MFCPTEENISELNCIEQQQQSQQKQLRQQRPSESSIYDSGITKFNELRYFNLYRYYLSQHPEIFSRPEDLENSCQYREDASGETVVPSTASIAATGSMPVYPITFPTRFDLTEDQQQYLTYLSGLDEEQLTAKLTKLSLYRSKSPNGKSWRRSQTETDSSGDDRCCLTCRCTSTAHHPSDSSQLSLSEPDLNQLKYEQIAANISHRLNQQKQQQLFLQQQQEQSQQSMLSPNIATTADRYSYLSRVITPPNDFLNHSNHNYSGKASTTTAAFVDDSNQTTMFRSNTIDSAQSSTKTISFSNKVTQTESSDLSTDASSSNPIQSNSSKAFKAALLQRYHSFANAQESQQQQQQRRRLYVRQSSSPVDYVGGGGQNCGSTQESAEHIYYTILDQSRQHSAAPAVDISSKKSGKMRNKEGGKFLGRARSLRRSVEVAEAAAAATKPSPNEISRNAIASSMIRQSPNKIYDSRVMNTSANLLSSTTTGAVMAGAPQAAITKSGSTNATKAFAWSSQTGKPQQRPQIEEAEHRIATSKNGIPCDCERCRESRGLNLTTELLPLDAQIPLHSMDIENIDSFLQDSAMTELICTIL